MKEDQEYIYGVQYWRPPTPTRGEWDDDLKNIKAAGFNLVKIWLIWRWHERVEGSWIWDDSDEIFRLCEKHGLLVNANIIMDYAPEWAFRKFGCYRLGPNGEKLFNGGCGWFPISGCWPCYDGDGVRTAGERFITQLALRYNDNPQLHSWDVWNEPKNLGLYDCFCDHSKSRYREWLKSRYGNIESYNQIYGKAWGSFAEVEPPGEMKDYTEMLNWKEWAMFRVSDQLEWVAGAVRAVDGNHKVISHAGMCLPLAEAIGASSDELSNSEQVDFYGSSLSCESEEECAQGRVGLICDWIRSVSPYYWINEIYPRLPNWCRSFGSIAEKNISPAALKLMVWECIARGAGGTIFWQYKNERMGVESDGFGLIQLDGTDDGHLEVASHIGKVIAANNELFLNLKREKADVTLLYDLKSDIVSNIEDHDYFQGADYSYKRALTGSYKLFWQNGINVDFVDTRHIERILEYKAVYLPLPVVMQEGTAEMLKRYIENGGTVISEAYLASRQSNTWISRTIPGCGLDEVFGVIEKQQVVSEKTRKMSAFGIDLNAVRVFSTLHPTKAAAVGHWEDGSPALTVCNYGKGRAIMIGASLGITGSVSARRLLGDLLGEYSGLKCSRMYGLVKVERLKTSDGWLLFVFNYENQSQDVVLENFSSEDVRKLIGNIEFTKEGLRIPPMEVAVLNIIDQS